VSQQLKGIGAARKNSTNHRHKRHAWSQPYNRTCIISDCESSVYWDGDVWWTCCLHHLQKHQFGPFAPRVNHDTEGWPLRGADASSVVAEALFYRDNHQHKGTD
jgi:hypothetical protein